MGNWIKQAEIFGLALDHVTTHHDIGGDIESYARGARYVSFSVRLWDERDLDKALKLGDKMADRARTPTVVVQRNAGVLVYQFELRKGFWRSYTRANLKTERGMCGVGFTDNQKQVNLSFNVPHVLVAGTTGSGKTETAKSMLVGLFNAYQPRSELEAVIVDPKNDYYTWFENCAHLAYPIARNDDEINGALLATQREMERRRDAGLRDGPRLVVLIDEAESVLRNKKLLAMAQNVARQGRAFNVNLIISSQEPTNRTLPGVLGNVLNRWCGKLENARTAVAVTGHAGTSVHHLGLRGDFLHMCENQTERLQVAMATRQDYDRLPRAEMSVPPAPDDGDIQEFDEPEEGPEAAEPEVLTDEDQRGRGRPATEVEPDKIGLYLATLGQVTPKQAERRLGLTKHAHYQVYKPWAEAAIKSTRRWYKFLQENEL
jgi:DNA polymerase III delta prime subunit